MVTSNSNKFIYLAMALLLSACGGGESANKSIANVTTTDSTTPTVTLSSDAYTINADESITLYWAASGVSSCSASGGDWSGAKPLEGNETIGPFEQDMTLTITCSGDNGTVSGTVDIVVNQPGTTPAPAISLSASTEQVDYLGSATLNWSTTNADSCIATGNWSGNQATSGSLTLDGLTESGSYNIKCIGNGGNASASVDISVQPTVTFSASQNTVASNGSTTLSWTSTNATSCEATGDWSGTKATAGSQTINSIISDQVFTLSCSGAGGTASYTLNIQVLVSNNGTALISWTPPTENTDNSTLNDLTGYKIYYGTSSGNYTNTINIDNPGLTSYLVENLAANTTWYFVMTAYNANNIESAYSEEKSKTIN